MFAPDLQAGEGDGGGGGGKLMLIPISSFAVLKVASIYTNTFCMVLTQHSIVAL